MLRHFASLAVFAASAHASDVVKLEISADDRMVYSKSAFEVVSGQKVSLVFKNTSGKGAKAMKHNIVLLRKGVDVMPFAVKCNAAGAAAGYVPTDEASKKQMIGHTKLLAGGETDTIQFVAGEPGDYLFFCSSPGHFDKMHGKITVKPAP